MPELTTKEVLQPSLLERLTDSRPEGKLDTIEERVMSFRRFRESVIRDIEWLLNTGAIQTTTDLTDYPEVRRSTLNYGVPDMAGSWAENKDTEELERELRQAILDFEPRILPSSLSVRVNMDTEKMDSGTMNFEIEGELWWQPLPERFYLRTTLDLELGSFKFDDRE